jgi:hypothetical protein
MYKRSLLDEAEEQCRQVLIAWQHPASSSDTPTEIDISIYVALAYLICIYVQRATWGRLNGYEDIAVLERVRAANLCQDVLNTLSENTFPWTLINKVMNSQMDSLDYQDAYLPRLPSSSSNPGPLFHNPISLVEVYFAAGEVAEELGRAATTQDYILDCYTHADRCFQAALSAAQTLASESDHEVEPNYLSRCYQRCISILEERSLKSPTLSEETTRTLLDMLISGLRHLQYPSSASLREVG